MSGAVSFTIIGEPASKANSRSVVKINGVTRVIKSAKARSYFIAAALQAPRVLPPLSCPLRMSARLFYANEKSDLDPSVLLDALQGIVYVNDRQVRELHLYHGIDKRNPRAEVWIAPLEEKIDALVPPWSTVPVLGQERQKGKDEHSSSDYRHEWIRKDRGAT